MDHNIPGSLQNLIGNLSECQDIGNLQISEIVSQTKFRYKDFEPYFTFNHPDSESYGRKLIFDNGNYKILLMSWKPGDFTAIHNHGHTEWGCVYFFGNATHRLYEVEQNTLISVKKGTFSSGQVALVCGELTHLMGNSGDKDLATLHIYGSNTRKDSISENAKIFAPEHQKIFTTKGTAFLNMSKLLIQEEAELPPINPDLLEDYFGLVKPFYKRNGISRVLTNMEKQLNQFTSA
jgi:hypothetical protein